MPLSAVSTKLLNVPSPSAPSVPIFPVLVNTAPTVSPSANDATAEAT